jgi:ribosome-binding protein aMBF1 (putative translation factor)
MGCELCDEATIYGFYVCLRIKGSTWRWLRVCESCYGAYLQMEDDE